MNEVTSLLDADLSDVDAIERATLSLPQVKCGVAHHFGPGVYIREVTIPAGTFAVGHYQKTVHMNVMLTGEVHMPMDGGGFKTLVAPMIFTGQPGRKVGYVTKDMTWLNVYSTDERNIDTLEATYLDKSEAFMGHHKSDFEASSIAKEIDRQDYTDVLNLLGVTDEQAWEETSRTEDMTDWSSGSLSVRKSPIHGVGIFASTEIPPQTPIGPAKINGKRTILGRYVNHSKKPNCFFVTERNGDVTLYSGEPIVGCLGGDSGVELTVDYRGVLRLMKEARSLCQQ